MKHATALFSLLLLIFLAGCKPKEAVWLEINRGWRVTVVGDQATIEDLVLDRKGNVTLHDASGSTSYFFDADGKFFGGREIISLYEDKGALTSTWGDLRFTLVPSSPETEHLLSRIIGPKREIQASRRNAADLAEQDYIPIDPRSIPMIIGAYRLAAGDLGRDPFEHQRITREQPEYSDQLTDEEIAVRFIPGFSSEQNSFKRAELMKLVPATRDQLTRLAMPMAVRLPFRHPSHGDAKDRFAWFFDRSEAGLYPYDIDAESFGFWHEDAPCTANKDLRYRYQVFREPFGLTEPSKTCRLEVKDRDLAERIEAARVSNSLRIELDVFVQLHGEAEKHPQLGVTPIFEVQMLRVYLFEAGPGKKEPLGPPDGFIVRPDRTISKQA